MNAWIPFLWFTSGFTYGPQIVTAEFANKPSCELALAAMQYQFDRGYMKGLCVPQRQ